MLEGLIILAQLMTIVRLIRVYYELLSLHCRKNPEGKIEEDALTVRKMSKKERLLEGERQSDSQ
jgi:hypothetical protein